MRANKRVVVTGIGVVSSIGVGLDAFWKELLAGRSGISDVQRFDTSSFPVHRAGEIKGFVPADFMPDRVAKGMGRGSQLAIAATKLALEDSGMKAGDVSDAGSIVLGTTMGEIPSLELIDKYWVKAGEGDVYAENISKYPVNNLSGNVATYFRLTGRNYVLPNACAAGNCSLGFGYDLIRTGRETMVLAGGVDPLSRLAFTGFNRLFAMAPEKCQPFDKNRKGMMLGEGAGILALEDLGRARARGAKIYAEILGYGLSCDAFNMTIPNEGGVYKVMEKAIRNSGIAKDAVDYISAHGTGTGLNDKTESAAIRRVFGDRAGKVPVSSIKSMLGHTMGAASALEAVSCCMAIRDGVIPPTINYEMADPECDLDYVPNRARKAEVRVVLNNSFAFGGNNACLVLSKCGN